MKPHLPTILLAAVLACISQPVIATETINLNTHDWDQYVGKTPEFDNVNLSLDGNWSVNLDKFHDPCWGSTDNGSYTLTGQGTMDFKMTTLLYVEDLPIGLIQLILLLAMPNTPSVLASF